MQISIRYVISHAVFRQLPKTILHKRSTCSNRLAFCFIKLEVNGMCSTTEQYYTVEIIDLLSLGAIDIQYLIIYKSLAELFPKKEIISNSFQQ
ncbi:hypothetical protein T10_11085 [Trichinella papuae]|uniref:Uncharacterized protein n=1 Tax=Trichinella papuae TaxID=268474 RepID=A0A0V1M3M2_9BILA|nr:hypothetical protein T10_11085 [Trichinella papuae]